MSALVGILMGSESDWPTMKSYDGSVHGVSLFAKDRDLQPAIVQWLQSVMK